MGAAIDAAPIFLGGYELTGSNGMVRALNLDESEVAVTIGGRGFILKQQAKAPLMRVLDAMFVSETSDLEAATTDEEAEPTATETLLEDNIARTFMKEWEKALPIIAMMFGFDPSKEDTWKDAVAYLEENLAPMAGVKVFKAWWVLNEIDSFFIRCGRTLMHPEMERQLELSARRQMEENAREAVAEALPSASA